jgi:hypothetical protein
LFDQLSAIVTGLHSVVSGATGIPPTGGAAAMSRYSLANGSEIEAV